MAENTDHSWETYGRDDPYYGVFPMPRFRRANLTPQVLQEFFAYGEVHISDLDDRLRRHFGTELRGDDALDFGCGVGRIVLPMARRFGQVIGVDVSPGMLDEATRHCRARDVTNVSLYQRLEEVPADLAFDFVHSYIVLQHIDLPRQRHIVDELLRRLKVGGIAALHITVLRDATLPQRVTAWLRRHVPVVNGPINFYRQRPWGEPVMAMNSYAVEHMLLQMQAHTDDDLVFRPEWHQGYLGAMILMRKTRKPTN